MFGFKAKSKYATKEVAKGLVLLAWLPVLKPTAGDDANFATAVAEGVDPRVLRFEFMSLLLYVVGAAINRERLENRLDMKLASALVDDVLEYGRYLLFQP